MSELDQLVKILKAIASQQRANALAISQLTANIESLAAEMEEDRQQRALHAHMERVERLKLRAMVVDIMRVIAIHLTEDKDSGKAGGDLNLDLNDNDSVDEPETEQTWDLDLDLGLEASSNILGEEEMVTFDLLPSDETN
ncbi:hypothetical protein [Pantanalinema sp. GBBB05]|uniref:hypothetical protein n=1 Tax=Pantanalinema sp. GBBB05 TaxID=2604139 RepID=UPI001DA3262C|nr:hypothetical protein [Pantanalinema sp. GBBB05]